MKVFDVTMSVKNANVSIKYCVSSFLSLDIVVDKFASLLYDAVAEW